MLDNLNADYKINFVQMALRGRLFVQVASFYMDSRHKKLRMDEQLVLDFCLLMSNDPKNGIDLWKKILEENPNAVEMPYGKLIKATHFVADQTFEWVFGELDALIATAEDIIAHPADYAEKCRGKKLATLFFENAHHDLAACISQLLNA